MDHIIGTAIVLGGLILLLEAAEGAMWLLDRRRGRQQQRIAPLWHDETDS